MFADTKQKKPGPIISDEDFIASIEWEEPGRSIRPQNVSVSNDLVFKVLTYPPDVPGGITIDNEDYKCLAAGAYLFDVIIDMYLQYVHREVLGPNQRSKVHIFSGFFYDRLKGKLKPSDREEAIMNGVDYDSLTDPQKCHYGVKRWTKNVDIFAKDFVIIPINEKEHWFLAIICFPALRGPVTYEGNIPLPKKKVAEPKYKTRKQSPIVVEDYVKKNGGAAGGSTIVISDSEEGEQEDVVDLTTQAIKK